MKKITKTILTVMPIVGVAGGVGTYLAVEMKSDDSNTRQNNNHKEARELSSNDDQSKNDGDLLTKFQVFPEIVQNDFYKYIKINEGIPEIDSDMISEVVTYILKKTQISDGTINWGYEISGDKQELILSFVWNSSSQGRTFRKVYTLNISNAV